MPEEQEKIGDFPPLDRESQKYLDEARTLYTEFVKGRMRAGNLPGEPDRSPRGRAFARVLQVLEKHPKDPRPLFLLGVIYHGMGEHPSAEDCLTKALAAGASNPDLHRILAVTYLEREANDEAKKHIEILKQHDEARQEICEMEAEIALRKGNWDERLSALEDLIEILPNDEHPAVALITTLLKMKKNKAAFEELIEFDEIIPDSAEIKFLLGNVYADNRKFKLAMESYRKALALNPDHNTARFELANTLDELGKTAEALKLYEEYIDVITDDPDAYYNAAGVAERLEDRELAIKYYLEYLKYSGDEEEFKEVLDWLNNNAPGNIDPGELQVKLAVAHLEQDDPESALKELKVAKDIGIEDRRTLFLSGKANASLDRYDVAVEFYKKAMEHDDFAGEQGFSDEDILIAAGDASLELGNLDDASETARELLKGETLVDGHRLTGDILMAKKDYEKARDEYVQSLRIDLFSFDAMFGLGDVYDANKNYRDASTCFRLCLEIEPDDPDALYRLGLDNMRLGYIEWGKFFLAKYLDTCPKGACADEARRMVEKHAFEVKPEKQGK